jgi:hypothetical protein
MEELAYFKTHAKREEEEVVVQYATPDQRAFADCALELIGAVAAEHGFERKTTKVEPFSVQIIYRKGGQSLEVRGGTDPREQPDYYNIILGVEVAAGVMYTVALWRMQRIEEGTDAGTEYAFPYREEVRPSLARAAAELKRFGAGFLKGDLALFEAAKRKFATGGGYG